MRNRADYQVRMDGTSAGLVGAVQRAERSLGGLNRAAGVARAGLGGLVAGVGITGFARLTKASLDFADSIAKNARTVGVLPGLYQELSFAASQSGVAQGQLDAALNKFTKNIGEARLGTGTMVTTLRQYDEALLNSITASNSVEDATRLIFDALNNAGDAADRAAIATAAFGRSGTRLQSVAQNYDELAERANAFGLVLSDNVLSNAEKSNDALDLLSKTAASAFSVLSAELAPTIQSFSETFASATVEILRFAQVMGNLNPQNITDLTTASAALIKEQEDLEKFTNEIERLQKIADLPIDPFNGTGNLTLNAINGIENFTEKAEASRERIAALEKQIAELNGTAVVIDFVEPTSREVTEFGQLISEEARDALAAARATATKEANQAASEIQAIRDRLFEEQDVSIRFQFQVDRVNELVEAGLAADEATEFIKILRAEAAEEIQLGFAEVDRSKFAEAEEFVSEAARNQTLDVLGEIRTEIEGTADSFRDSFIEASLSATGSFSDFADSIIQQLARIALQAALSPIFDAITSGIGGFVSGAFGGGSAVSSTASAAVSTTPTGRTAVVNTTESFGKSSGVANLIINKGASDADPQVSQGTDSDGRSFIEVTLEKYTQKLVADTVNGQGLAPAINSRFVVAERII